MLARVSRLLHTVLSSLLRFFFLQKNKKIANCVNLEALDYCISFTLRYVMENHGIDTEAGYPSIKPVGECHFDPKHIGATCTGLLTIAL